MGYHLRPMNAQNGDPLLLSMREEIAAADRDLLAAFSRRVRVAAEIRRHKHERGYDFIDPEREGELLAEWRETNAGTISGESLLELFETVLRLSKRESSDEGSGESRPAERA
jgi:chorismate mutase